MEFRHRTSLGDLIGNEISTKRQEGLISNWCAYAGGKVPEQIVLYSWFSLA